MLSSERSLYFEALELELDTCMSFRFFGLDPTENSVSSFDEQLEMQKIFRLF